VIRVVVDDLAGVAVDAILRPADQSLDPVTPAISRLDQQAGQRFEAQRRVNSPLEAGAAVVTGGGDLKAPYVLHVVIRDPASPVRREVVRRALVSAWQRASDWGLGRIAAPLVGAGAGQLSPEEAAALLAETFPRNATEGPPAELHIVVEREEERAMVEAILRRTA
jgi:O-acetyl-ADP-ribose deacetylase (regulator of RNase III)